MYFLNTAIIIKIYVRITKMCSYVVFFCFKHKTAYELRISDWSSDVCSSDLIAGYDFSSRTARRHCAEILIHLGYHRMKRVDRAQLTEWIAGELCPGGQSINAMLEHVFLWCRDRRIYGPSRKE